MNRYTKQDLINHYRKELDQINQFLSDTVNADHIIENYKHKLLLIEATLKFIEK